MKPHIVLKRDGVELHYKGHKYASTRYLKKMTDADIQRARIKTAKTWQEFYSRVGW
jgi:hypothetical protein